jgi:MFS family permease
VDGHDHPAGGPGGVDRIGAKRAWLAALAVFLVGSVLCGIAWSAGEFDRVSDGAGSR